MDSLARMNLALAYIEEELVTIDALLSENPHNTTEIRELVSTLQGHLIDGVHG